MKIEITRKAVDISDYSAGIEYTFKYGNKTGSLSVFIDELHNELDYVIEFDGIEYEWGVEDDIDDNNFDPEFKEAFLECFFIKIP